MRINSRKVRKILGRIWTAPKRIFETFCTQETPRCISMNATLTTFYLIHKIKQEFSYTIFPIKKNKCWKSFKNYGKIVI
jgi:galactose-1-phosphate uridylyltransferase